MSNDSTLNAVQKKICLLGDFSVGKTSLTRRYVEGRFDDRYLSTLGVKITRKRLEDDGRPLNLLIWDLAGGDDYTSPNSSYLRGAAGALIVCDLTRSSTLAALERYTDQLRLNNERAAIVLAANKADLESERVISKAEIEEVAARIGAPCFDTSAKTGSNVEAMFAELAGLLRSLL